MQYHQYQPEDAEGLDKLLDNNRHGSVRLNMDRIVVAGPVGKPEGALVWRPMAFIHQVLLPRSLGSRSVARGLISYARATAADRICFVKEAAFVIDPDNSAMLRYATECGAVSEQGQLMYAPIKLGGQG